MDSNKSSTDTSGERESRSGQRSRRFVPALVCAALAMGVGGGAWWLRSQQSHVSLEPVHAAAPLTAHDTADTTVVDQAAQQLQQAVVGEWKLQRDGERLLKLRADGTATMDVTLTGWQAALFGERMRFDIRWSVEGRELVLETTGGEPTTAVDAVTKIYGVVRRQPILEANTEHLLLQDPDEGEADHDYRRVPSAATP